MTSYRAHDKNGDEIFPGDTVLIEEHTWSVPPKEPFEAEVIFIPRGGIVKCILPSGGEWNFFLYQRDRAVLVRGTKIKEPDESIYNDLI